MGWLVPSPSPDLQEESGSPADKGTSTEPASTVLSETPSPGSLIASSNFPIYSEVTLKN